MAYGVLGAVEQAAQRSAQFAAWGGVLAPCQRARRQHGCMGFLAALDAAVRVGTKVRPIRGLRRGGLVRALAAGVRWSGHAQRSSQFAALGVVGVAPKGAVLAWLR